MNKQPNLSQRKLADKLGFSLENKLHIKALKDKGFNKINNFSKNPNNLIMYTYLLQKEYQKN